MPINYTYDLGLMIGAVSVGTALVLWFVIMIGLLFIIIANNYDLKERIEVAAPSVSLLETIDEKLSTENKLDTSLDDIIHMTRLRAKTERRMRQGLSAYKN
jgi:hypothetical protein